jgi:hypothetical protein
MIRTVRYFVVTARLRKGSASKVLEILRQGPSFDVGATSLDRHLVFLSEEELIFLFEGEHADEQAERLLAMPKMLGPAGRIGAHLAGSPGTPVEVFSWERPPRFDGVCFGPYPGPGDSEGGLAE